VNLQERMSKLDGTHQFCYDIYQFCLKMETWTPPAGQIFERKSRSLLFLFLVVN